MTHPLIPKIIELASPVAASLGLEVVGGAFHTNQNPPVLRIDIRNQTDDTGLDDCEQMSRALESALDAAEIIPDRYVLEISSPGVSRILTSDRDFQSFKGFPVAVTTVNNDTQRQLRGKLMRRDEATLYLNQKGRTLKIPREQVTQVLLDEED